MHDKYFNTKKFKIEAINNCRLYSQVFTIGELTNNDVHPILGVMKGNFVNTSPQLYFEKVKKPPESAWREWKSFIFRKFIMGNNTISPELIKMPKTQRNSKEMNICIHTTIEEKLATIPTDKRELLSSIDLPQDNDESLIKAILQGEALGASNGLLIQDTMEGGYGYSLQSMSSNVNKITGGGKIPKSNNMTSLTAELYGIIGILSTIYLHKERDFSLGKVIIATDNEEEVERTNNECIPTNVSETWCPDYDLWKQIWDIKNEIPIQISANWVKGHQNVLEDGRKIYGPYPQIVDANIEREKLANKFRDSPSMIYYQQQTTKHTVLSIMDDKGIMINDISKFLYNLVNGNQMKQYINKK